VSVVELRLNTKTNETSWGFSDGKLFYPFGTTEVAKAMATFLQMKFQNTGQIESDMTGDPDSDWRKI